MPKKLTVATCQFPTSENIKRNARYICDLIVRAKKQGAHVAHFSECALSGYAGAHFETWDGYDWDLLRSETEQIFGLCRKRNIWAVIGSSHPLSGDHLPHNCQYIVNNKGKIVDRYDKRHCSEKDLRSYAPGIHDAEFEINGLKCATRICLEFRAPDMYHQLAKRGVWCVFHSTYGARADGPDIFTEVIPGTMQGHAANNGLWISHANASGYYQSFPSAFINPSGQVKGMCKRHKTDLTLNTIDFAKNGELYTFIRQFRDKVRSGAYYRDKRVRDARSRNRTQL